VHRIVVSISHITELDVWSLVYNTIDLGQCDIYLDIQMVWGCFASLGRAQNRFAAMQPSSGDRRRSGEAAGV
jgi:hypothetical protein